MARERRLRWIICFGCGYLAWALRSMMTTYDPSTCMPLVWKSHASIHTVSTISSSALSSSATTDSDRPSLSRRNVSYVLTLSSSSSSQLKRLLSQVKALHDLTNLPITILIQNNLPEISSILKQIKRSLKKLNSSSMIPSTQRTSSSEIKVMQMSHPLEKNILTKSYMKLLLDSFQYANPNQFFQLNLLLLPFEKVIYINSYLKILKPVDHLFSCPIDVFYTNAPFHYFDQNIYLLKSGDEHLFNEMMSYLKSYSWKEGLHPYQSALQEFLYYYFIKLPGNISSIDVMPKSATLTVKRLNSCLYNFQKYPELACVADFFQQNNLSPTWSGVSPYLVRSSSSWLDLQLDTFLSPPKPPAISTFNSYLDSSAKPCIVDFWIIGARKSGTTALYTWLTEHPQVAPLNIRHRPTDGEIMIPLSSNNLIKYNKMYYDSLKSYLASEESSLRGNYTRDSILVGDSWVGRFVNDDYRTISICKEKNIKILLILRNPIERCISQWKMRYRREFGQQSPESSPLKQKGFGLNMILEKELNDYNLVTKNNSLYFSPLSEEISSPLIPPSLHSWKGSGINCIYEGMYSVHLRRWLVAHGIDNIRVYFTEDMDNYPSEVIYDALEFIGVDDPTLWKYDPIRHAKRLAPNRDTMNLTVVLETSLMRRLQEVFRPSNRELERLLGISTVPWGY